MENLPENYNKYEKHYSEESLKDKVLKVAKDAGAKIIYGVLVLYYILMSDNVSATDKAKICGALGYFILPIDLIPDFIPVAGYTDDLAAIIWALYAVKKNITPEIKQKAKNKLKDWFDEINEDELDRMIQ